MRDKPLENRDSLARAGVFAARRRGRAKTEAGYQQECEEEEIVVAEDASQRGTVVGGQKPAQAAQHRSRHQQDGSLPSECGMRTPAIRTTHQATRLADKTEVRTDSLARKAGVSRTIPASMSLSA